MPHLGRLMGPAMGDALVEVVEEEAGTIMVKRYRLVLPGETPQ